MKNTSEEFRKLTKQLEEMDKIISQIISEKEREAKNKVKKAKKSVEFEIKGHKVKVQLRVLKNGKIRYRAFIDGIGLGYEEDNIVYLMQMIKSRLAYHFDVDDKDVREIKNNLINFIGLEYGEKAKKLIRDWYLDLDHSGKDFIFLRLYKGHLLDMNLLIFKGRDLKDSIIEIWDKKLSKIIFSVKLSELHTLYDDIDFMKRALELLKMEI